MLRGRRNPVRDVCEHVNSITATSAGVTRIVCEDCGSISFESRIELSQDLHREMFAREADLAVSPVG